MAGIRALLRSAKVDVMLLANSEQLTDFSFLRIAGVPYGSLSDALLVATAKRTELLASPLEMGAAGMRRGISAVRYSSQKELKKLLAARLGGKRVGLNYESLTKENMDNLRKIVRARKFVDVGRQLRHEREIKTNAELARIRTACRIAEEAIAHAASKVSIGMSELQIAKEIEIAMLRSGAQGASFPVIVAAGANASVPHHVSCGKKAKRGELLLIDAGARWMNYVSDISRTFVVGRATEAQETLYSKVHEALARSIRMAREGVAARDIYAAANGMIKKASGKELAHSLGHGIGLQDHDAPGAIGAKSKWVLKRGMALAIEPAIYMGKAGGIRIEDNIAVGACRCTRYTKAPKELVRL